MTDFMNKLKYFELLQVDRVLVEVLVEPSNQTGMADV